jgi:hypothetical protein
VPTPQGASTAFAVAILWRQLILAHPGEEPDRLLARAMEEFGSSCEQEADVRSCFQPAVAICCPEQLQRLALISAALGQANSCLDGFLFHGTCSASLPSIRAVGMRAGSHWGTLDVALHFAEDAAGGHGPDVSPVLLAVGKDVIRASSPSADFAMVDDPLGSGPIDPSMVEDAWRSSRKDWRASLRIAGAVLCRKPIPSCLLHVIQVPEQALHLLAGPGVAAGMRP